VEPRIDKGVPVKALVATKRTQGSRSGDFCHAVEGELVCLPPVTCDCPDCGCDRSIGGLSSRGGTTTFTIVDRPDLDEESYRRVIRDHLVAAGWNEELGIDVWFDEYIRSHLAIASDFEVGDILEISGGRVARRDLPVP
jgi:hypothetical protein